MLCVDGEYMLEWVRGFVRLGHTKLIYRFAGASERICVGLAPLLYKPSLLSGVALPENLVYKSSLLMETTFPEPSAEPAAGYFFTNLKALKYNFV